MNDARLTKQTNRMKTNNDSVKTKKKNVLNERERTNVKVRQSNEQTNDSEKGSAVFKLILFVFFFLFYSRLI